MDDLFAAPAGRHSLFFALVPDPGTGAGIRAAQHALEAGLPAQRGGGVPDVRLHLTLHWLGEWSQLPETLVADARLAAAQVHQDPFHLRLDQAECFGHGEAIWVLRPSATPEGLAALHRSLAACLARQRVRLPGGPSFAPHVSVRRRAGTRFPTRGVTPVEWSVRDFALLHSRHPAAGNAYEVLGRWPLSTGA